MTANLGDKNNSTIAQLTHLNWIYVPVNLVEHLPMKFIQKYRDDEFDIQELPLTMLYKPLEDNYRLSIFGFFLTSDNWNEEALKDLKYKTGAEFIIGLQTTKKSIEKFAVIDGIILCQDSEIASIMRLIKNTVNHIEISGVDCNDFRETMRFNKPAHFIKSRIFGADEIDRSQKTITQLLGQIPQDITIKRIIIMIKNNSPVSLDEFILISEAVENRGVEDDGIWYNFEIVDKPNCFCIEAIYMVE